MADTVVVVGGANIDIVAAPYSGFKEHDSNPGRSSISFGGVGRNIAENLAHLGCNVRFVSVFGDDMFSRMLVQDLENKEIDISLSKTVRGETCSKYVCINSDKGELVAAINDMSLYDHMHTAITEEAIRAMNEADMVVLDANTSEALLENITSRCTVPIAFDAVSISKVPRCRNILNRLFIFKPNLYEAEELCKALESGADINATTFPDTKDPTKDHVKGSVKDSANDPEEGPANDLASRAARYAAILLANGVKNVMISLGSDGVYYDNGTERGIIPSMSSDIVNTSGCGDTFLAGAIKGYLAGCNVADMVRYGSAAAAVCAASEATVAPELNLEALRAVLSRSLNSGDQTAGI